MYKKIGIEENYMCLSEPQLLKLPKSERVLMIRCGYSHCICVGSSGNCYVWGENADGRLGTYIIYY